MGIKIPMKRTPNYFKWVSWTQPVFTTEDMGTLGVVSASSSYSTYTPKGALDGVKSGTDQNKTWVTNNKTTGWWKLVLPCKIKITAINFYNGYYGSRAKNINGRFYADEAKTVPIGDAISTPVDSWYLTQIANIPADGVYTDTLYFEKTGGNAYAGIGELEITAYTKEAGSSEDYDFIEYDLKPAIFMRNIPHYRKYVPWTQPVFSGSNIASDGSVINSESIRSGSTDYGAMDGVKSGTNTLTTWQADNSTNCYWKVVFPYKIKITGLTHYNARQADNKYRNIQGRFYADEAMSVPIGDAISTPVYSWYQTPIVNIPSEGIVTDTINFRKTGGDPLSGIGELEITATKVVEGSAEYYDFLEWSTPCRIFAERVPHYFKWEALSQPVLSANGDMGGSSFAVEATTTTIGAPYCAFDNSSSTYWQGDRHNIVPQSLTFYNPIALKVSTITITNGSTTSGAPLTGTIYGSNDNITWVQICTYSNSVSTAGASWDIVVNSQTAYNYHKILVSTVSGTDGWQIIREIDIVAYGIEETGTAEDYDFMEYSL